MGHQAKRRTSRKAGIEGNQAFEVRTPMSADHAEKAPRPAEERFCLPPIDSQVHLARQLEKNPFAEDLGLRARLIQQEDGEYSEEFILQAVHQMCLAKVPCDQMARRFGVSLRTVMRWRAALREKFRDEALLLEPQAFIGKTLKHYEAITAAAWQLYMTGRTHSDRVRGLDAARACEADLQRFMHLAGFYDAVQFQPPQEQPTDRSTCEAELLRTMSQQLLAGFSELVEEAE